MNDYEMLPREEQPPAALEERVVKQLREAGAFRPPLRRRLVAALAAAAALVIGFTAGLLMSRDSEPAGPMFVLLLHGGADGHVDEYRAWAVSLRERNALVGGEKLKDASTILGRGAATDPVRGYFVITARDAAEAERIAGECPHLRYGGWIEMREIEKT